MEHADKNDVATQVKQLVSENINLRIKLEEYQFNAVFKEQEMLDMKLQIVTGNELISKLDNQVLELKLLQNYMDDLSKQTESETNRESNFQHQYGQSIGFTNQLDAVKQQNNHLQMQVAQLQTQLQELSNRNLLFQQQVGKVAELESYLADALQERDEWKALTGLK